MKEKNIGSSFDSWLREEGIYQHTSHNSRPRAGPVAQPAVVYSFIVGSVVHFALAKVGLQP
jgi:hypothetical protein